VDAGKHGRGAWHRPPQFSGNGAREAEFDAQDYGAVSWSIGRADNATLGGTGFESCAEGKAEKRIASMITIDLSENSNLEAREAAVIGAVLKSYQLAMTAYLKTQPASAHATDKQIDDLAIEATQRFARSEFPDLKIYIYSRSDN
jgi:hypothetical protein